MQRKRGNGCRFELYVRCVPVAAIRNGNGSTTVFEGSRRSVCQLKDNSSSIFSVGSPSVEWLVSHRLPSSMHIHSCGSLGCLFPMLQVWPQVKRIFASGAPLFFARWRQSCRLIPGFWLCLPVSCTMGNLPSPLAEPCTCPIARPVRIPNLRHIRGLQGCLIQLHLTYLSPKH
uniref:Uncharacterized protein n=1 Tax=Dechloromonas aromatica (strain RCB) TaxID=159087 RepID=Q47FW6_DECAR